MDKLVNITEVGTVQQHELGLELEDMRGRQGDIITTRLFPTSAAGGGQTAQNYIVNRYRPGNKYKYVRANATITRWRAVKFDVTFATVLERAANVIHTAAAVAQAVAGVWEQGTAGPEDTDFADPETFAAGTFSFITTRGLCIVKVAAGVAAGEAIGTGAGAAGQLVDIGASASVPDAIYAASGLGLVAMSAVDTPATGYCYAQIS